MTSNPVLAAVAGGVLVWFLTTQMNLVNKSPVDMATVQANQAQFQKNQDQFAIQLTALQAQVNATAVETGRVQILLTEQNRRLENFGREFQGFRALLQGMSPGSWLPRGGNDSPDDEERGKPERQSFERAGVP